MDNGAWRVIVHGVAKSQTQLGTRAHAWNSQGDTDQAAAWPIPRGLSGLTVLFCMQSSPSSCASSLKALDPWSATGVQFWTWVWLLPRLLASWIKQLSFPTNTCLSSLGFWVAEQPNLSSITNPFCIHLLTKHRSQWLLNECVLLPPNSGCGQMNPGLPVYWGKQQSMKGRAEGLWPAPSLPHGRK